MRNPSHGGASTSATQRPRLLYGLKYPELVVIIAPLGPTQELPLICGLRGTPHTGDECPTSRDERQEAKSAIEEGAFSSLAAFYASLARLGAKCYKS